MLCDFEIGGFRSIFCVYRFVAFELQSLVACFLKAVSSKHFYLLMNYAETCIVSLDCSYTASIFQKKNRYGMAKTNR